MIPVQHAHRHVARRPVDAPTRASMLYQTIPGQHRADMHGCLVVHTDHTATNFDAWCLSHDAPSVDGGVCVNVTAPRCTLEGCDSYLDGETVFAEGLCASCIYALSDAARIEGR